MSKPVYSALPLAIKVDIDPKPKERPRFSRGRAFTSPNNRKYEAELSRALRVGMQKCSAFNGPLSIYVRFGFLKAKNSKARFPGRADVDNYLKAVMDAANLIIYEDDSQILQVFGEKVWTFENEPSYILLIVDKFKEDTFQVLCDHSDDMPPTNPDDLQ